MKANYEQKRKRELQNAFLDSRYDLERQTVFFAERGECDSLKGAQKTFLYGQRCNPIRFDKSAGALLVQCADCNTVWHAWIR